jgi:hypothetical protein
VTIADFNADGTADLAVSGNGPGPAPSSVSILLGNGDGTLRAAVTYSSHMQLVLGLTTGSFFGTGTVDLAVAGAGLGFVPGNGDGTMQDTTTFLPPSGFYPSGATSPNVITGDFANDGQIDVAVPLDNVGYVGVALGTAGSMFNRVGTGFDVDYSLGGDPVAVTSADFNSDGWADLAVAKISTDGTNGTVSVLLNTHQWIVPP